MAETKIGGERLVRLGEDIAKWNANKILGKLIINPVTHSVLGYKPETDKIVPVGFVKIATGSYTGNGTSQSIVCQWAYYDGVLTFQPAYIEIVDVTEVVYRSIKMRSMPGSDYMRSVYSVSLGGNTVTLITSGQGITITSTGFSVGSEPSINNNGNTYCWFAIG